jgi:hypothetical protein
MNKKHLVLAGILCLGIIYLNAQLDLMEKAQLIGIQVDEKEGATPDEKLTDVSFIFIEQPSAYYNSFRENVLTIDFYDAILGEESLPKIEQPPFTLCDISQTKIDVNKDIEGLAPDLKDVVRITLNVDPKVKIDFTLTDDFNVISLSTVWAKEGKKVVTRKTKKKTKTWMWIAGGLVGASVGAVTYFFLTTEDDKPKEEEEEPWEPIPPDLPKPE